MQSNMFPPNKECIQPKPCATSIRIQGSNSFMVFRHPKVMQINLNINGFYTEEDNRLSI